VAGRNIPGENRHTAIRVGICLVLKPSVEFSVKVFESPWTPHVESGRNVIVESLVAGAKNFRRLVIRKYDLSICVENG
jgi:hypothetical protein